ncbi:MAG: GNAT family N-acetyltransferase [Acidimicrobiales bacterium]
MISDVFDLGWEAGTDFNYGLFLGSEVVGGCGLHDRLGVTDGLEIGYWVRTGRTGRGVATTAVGALCQAAFRLGEVTHVEIHHDKANRASSRVPAKLGFRLVREIADEVYAPAEVGISCEWRLDRPTGN